MKWNTLYRVYEIAGILTTLICWWVLAFTSNTAYNAHFIDLYHTLEQRLAEAKAETMKANSLLMRDVRRNGNSREGLDRIKRAKLLQKKTSAAIKEFEKTKNDLNNIIEKDEHWVRYLMLKKNKAQYLRSMTVKYLTWLNREFKDLDIPKMNTWIQENGTGREFTPAYVDNSHPVATITLLAQKQITLKCYEMEVMKKLGAYDMTVSTEHAGWFRIALIPVLNQIQVGNEYKADLFVNRPASRSRPRMKLNGLPVPIIDGRAAIKIKASKTGLNHHQGSITYRNKNKQDSTTRFNLGFWVK